MVVCIIGILAAIIIVWTASAQKKSAIAAYKTSMKSVQAGMELCVGSGGLASSGAPSNPICMGVNYPEISSKCGTQPYFKAKNPTNVTMDDWEVTTNVSILGGFWECKGCRLNCTVTGCVEASAPGSCN